MGDIISPSAELSDKLVKAAIDAGVVIMEVYNAADGYIQYSTENNWESRKSENYQIDAADHFTEMINAFYLAISRGKKHQEKNPNKENRIKKHLRKKPKPPKKLNQFF